MAERRENSVLFSLRELRQIEDERVKQEEDAEKAKQEAAKAAAEAAERAKRDAEEKAKREEEDRLLRIQQEKERQIREEQMRLEAEKHRAQVEAAARLEEARIQAEMHAAAAAAKHKTPVGLILGIVGAVVALSGGALAYVLLVVMPAREAAIAKQNEAQITEIRKQFKAQEAAFEQQQNDLKSRLAQTSDAVEKARLEAQMRANEAAQEEAKRKAATAIRAVAPKKKEGKSGGEKKLNCDPSTDPLCGSGL